MIPLARATAFPEHPEPLEDVGAIQPGDAGAAFGFALGRLAAVADTRPVVMVTTPVWLRERGRPFAGGAGAWGLEFGRLIWVRAVREDQALWALAEALKSGAVAGGLATAETPAFVATRRLDCAARAGRAVGILLRAGEPADLSAARRRWRIGACASQGLALDASAPGLPRFRAELVRRRDGPPGVWDVELEDETHCLRVVAGLADHGMDETGHFGGQIAGAAFRAA